MEQKHKDVLKKNMSVLVERTNLDILLPVLREKDVFPDKMIEPLLDLSKSDRSRKSILYMEIQRRGPNAFGELIVALNETGHWNLVELLSPEHKPTKVISISEAKKSQRSQQAGLHNPGTSAGVSTTSQPNKWEMTTKDKEYLSPLEDEEFGKIIVKKAEAFGESPNPEIMCYSMKSKKRGILFMINNIQFQNDVEKYREGALKDQKNLKELFTQIGFHEKIIHINKTKEEMETLLKGLASSEILKRTDCLFIVIASHGMSSGVSDTNIVSCDGNYIPSNDVLKMFNNENCPALHNIPKVFIFQVCRGHLPDFGVRSEPKEPLLNNRTELDGKVNNYSMRTYSDMLIVHSTVPGFSSHRDTILGSWYMLSLCKVFMNHAHDSHLEDLFKLVDLYLKDIKLKRNSLQTSSVENRGFNKFCFLNPGLPAET